jgi:hypothetical protein
MRLMIGETRSGRRVEIETDPTVRIQQFLAEHMSLDDRYDAFCLILYLRQREQSGWILTPRGSEGLFDDLAVSVESDPLTLRAIEAARVSTPWTSAFRDLEHGREIALPSLRR